MLACTIFSVFKICLTIPNNCAYYFLAITPSSIKLVRAINSDTKIFLSYKGKERQSIRTFPSLRMKLHVNTFLCYIPGYMVPPIILPRGYHARSSNQL